MRRIVVTGMGCVTPLGSSVEKFWESVKSGKSGIRVLEEFKSQGFPTYIGGTIVDLNPEDFMPRVEAKRFDQFIVYGIPAAMMAWKDAGLKPGEYDPTRCGSVVGSGIGGIMIFTKQHSEFMARGYKGISPFFIPLLITNMLSGQIAMRFGLKGPNFSISSACATSNHSMGTAFKLIQSGYADLMMAGGAESAINPMGLGGFISMKAVSTRNNAPEKASRPFDMDRDGFVMADGAGVLVLEELEHAKRRNAKIHAEIIGVGMSDDAYHIAAPHPEGDGAVLGMEMALKDAGISYKDVDYVNMHGTSTPAGDVSEVKAIKKTFKDHTKNLVVSSTKSMIGHMLGAAGAVEMIATIKTIQESLITPTINVENQDPECDIDVCANTARKKEVNIAVSNSFGFGGHNGVVVVRKYAG